MHKHLSSYLFDFFCSSLAVLRKETAVEKPASKFCSPLTIYSNGMNLTECLDEGNLYSAKAGKPTV